MSNEADLIPVEAADGHRWSVHAWVPDNPRASLLWLPALGVSARHYQAFAEALAMHRIAVFVHEWRGHGSSNRRAGRRSDWGYRQLLLTDIPASRNAVAAALPSQPQVIGGHSLGGQLACCSLALDRGDVESLWLVASGAPYWRCFPPRQRFWLPLAYRLLPWLANAFGALPGRRIGFGGSEARGVMHDWALTGLSGRYALPAQGIDVEAAMTGIRLPVHAVVMRQDWLAPDTSLRYLLSKLGVQDPHVHVLDSATLGTTADHFQWMRRPRAVAAALLQPRTGQPTVPGVTPNIDVPD